MHSTAPQMVMWEPNTMGIMQNQPHILASPFCNTPQVFQGEAIQVIPTQPQMVQDGQGVLWMQPHPNFTHRQEEDINGGVSYSLAGLVPGQLPVSNQPIVMVSGVPGQHVAPLSNHDFPQPSQIQANGPYYHTQEALVQRQILQTADGMQYVAICPDAQRAPHNVQPVNQNIENFPPRTNNLQIQEDRPILTPRRRNGFNGIAKGSDDPCWRKKSSERHLGSNSVALRRRSQSPADIIEIGNSVSASESIIPRPNKRLAPFLLNSVRIPHSQPGPTPADVIEAYNSDRWSAPDPRNLGKLLDVIEYYFSDECLSKNGYMLKQISNKSDGYVSIKKVASLKRIKQITRDIRTIVYSIRHSVKLEMSEDGQMVRRKSPLPDNLEAPRFIRSILAINLPTDNPTVEDVTSWFAEYGELTQVRILRPGKPLPPYLKDYTSWVPDLGHQYCAVVEFESQDEAQKACREINMKNRERFNLRVALLKPGARIRRTLYRKYKDAEVEAKQQTCNKDPKERTAAYHADKSNVSYRRARCYSQSSDGSEDSKPSLPQSNKINENNSSNNHLHVPSHNQNNKLLSSNSENDYDASASGSDTCSGCSDTDYTRNIRETHKSSSNKDSSWKKGSHSDSGYSHSSSDERDSPISSKKFHSRSVSPSESKKNLIRRSSNVEKNFVNGVPVGVLRQPKGPTNDRGFESNYRVIDSV